MRKEVGESCGRKFELSKRSGHTAGVMVIGVCVVMVLAGLVAVVRWGGLTVEPPRTPDPGDPGDPGDPPDPGEPPPVGQVVRRYLWDLNLAVIAGIGAGVVAAGAGGRLVMRLLAVTAGDGAQGRITEADQVVGRISVGGTLGFVIFTALFFGTASGGAYLLLRRWLPAGRAGGLAFGGLLLLLAGTRVEPLREGNVDFDLVGPGWVSPHDVNLYTVTDDADEAVDAIRGFWRNYQGLRWVGDRLVLNYDVRKGGRFREMIRALNGLETAPPL